MKTEAQRDQISCTRPQIGKTEKPGFSLRWAGSTAGFLFFYMIHLTHSQASILVLVLRRENDYVAMAGKVHLVCKL